MQKKYFQNKVSNKKNILNFNKEKGENKQGNSFKKVLFLE